MGQWSQSLDDSNVSLVIGVWFTAKQRWGRGGDGQERGATLVRVPPTAEDLFSGAPGEPKAFIRRTGGWVYDERGFKLREEGRNLFVFHVGARTFSVVSFNVLLFFCCRFFRRCVFQSLPGVLIIGSVCCTCLKQKGRGTSFVYATK